MSGIPLNLTNAEMDRTERMFTVKDEEYQEVAVGYMYGLDLKDARSMMTGPGALTEEKVADACDYFSFRDLHGVKVRGPYTDKQDQMYEKARAKRQEICDEYGLSPIDAIVKRGELAQQAYEEKNERIAQDFTKAVGSIPMDVESGIER